MSECFSCRLVYLRKRAGIKQADMAAKVGKSLSAYKLWEVGKNEPSMGILFKLAGLFDVSLDYLCGYEGKGTDPSASAIADERIKKALSIMRDALTKLEGTK